MLGPARRAQAMALNAMAATAAHRRQAEMRAGSDQQEDQVEENPDEARRRYERERKREYRKRKREGK